jgi:hypothetical protein
MGHESCEREKKVVVKDTKKNLDLIFLLLFEKYINRSDL